MRVGAVGTGLPTTSGQVIANLSGVPAGTGSPYAFFLADLSAGVAGADTLYVADDGAGIRKYSFDGTAWTGDGVVGAVADAYRGLTGSVSQGVVTLYATGSGGSGAAGGGRLVSFTDASGWGGALGGSATLLATAAANTAFRGVALLAPVPEPGPLALLVAGLAVLPFAMRRRG